MDTWLLYGSQVDFQVGYKSCRDLYIGCSNVPCGVLEYFPGRGEAM